MKKILLIVLAVPVLLALGHLALVADSRRALREVRLALERAGRPVQPEAILPAPVPEEDNGAPQLVQAATRLDAVKDGDTELRDVLLTNSTALRTGILDPTARDRLNALLDMPEVREARAAIREALAKKHRRFHFDYSRGFNPDMDLAPLMSLKSVCRLLNTDALLHAQGEPEKAWAALSGALTLADSVESEPLLIHQLVRLSLVFTTLENLRAAAAMKAPSQEAYQVLDGQLAALDSTAPLTRALDGERLLYGEWLFDPANRAKLPYLNMRDSFLFRWTPVRIRDQATYLGILGGLTRTTLSPRAPLAPLRDEDLADQVPLFCGLTRQMVALEDSFGLAGFIERYYVLLAEVRVTRAGLALLRHREATGTWPAVIPLPPEALADPFASGPLVLRPHEGGLIVYSVGPDRADNRGGEGDVAWLLR